MNFLFQNYYEIKNGLSNKKVFRKTGKKLNKIIVDFSKDEKEFLNFLNSYNILKKINISIPKIYEVYSKKKIIVMEDFGDNIFQNIIDDKGLYKLLKLGVDNLIIIQNSILEDDLPKLEKYNYINLKKEISEFVNYYIPYKKISDFSEEKFYQVWKKNYNTHNFEFNSFVHKDYEFINLIFINNKSLHLKCGIIDFQNAFIGFSGWDLFSILENPRLDLTREYNESLMKYFYENVNIAVSYDTFRNQYYLLNLARQTRLLGRWVKLYNQENNKYLNFILSTEKRIIACLGNIKDIKLRKMYEKYIM